MTHLQTRSFLRSLNHGNQDTIEHLITEQCNQNECIGKLMHLIFITIQYEWHYISLCGTAVMAIRLCLATFPQALFCNKNRVRGWLNCVLVLHKSLGLWSWGWGSVVLGRGFMLRVWLLDIDCWAIEAGARFEWW